MNFEQLKWKMMIQYLFFFVRISPIKDEWQAIDEIVPKKELVIVPILGQPKSWNASAAGISSWTNSPLFKQMWSTFV